MAELASSSVEQPVSKITFEVNLAANEVEVKYKDNPTWTHITKWKCGVVPATDDLQIHKELPTIMTLLKTFHDNLRVTLTRIRNRIHCILFVFGHDNLDSAFQMAIKVDGVKAEILKFLQAINPNLRNSSLSCWVGEQNESSEQDNKNSDEKSIKSESVVFSVTDNREGCTSETDWTCSFEHDEFEIDLTSSRGTFSRLRNMFANSYRSFLKRVRLGSLIIECEHQSREDALEMMKNHIKVKATILECLYEMDPRVTAIKVEVEYREIEKASSHPSEMEALIPGATQESELPATSREEETRKSGTPLGPDTRATPIPARRDPGADSDLRDASRKGNMAAVKLILGAGRADVNCRDEGRRTPVMAAALGGHRDVVELLVSEGADVSLVDEYDNNILHHACRGGDVETVKCVLSLNVADINSREGGNRTPVMWAADRGHRDVVELLVSEGADVSLVDKYGKNILHCACLGGDVETVKFVLSLHVADINSRGGLSWTPVMWAAGRGHRDVVELLVSEGADVSLVDEVGNNILHWACHGGDVETVKCVLSLNVVDIDARNNAGQTAADYARLLGHQEVVKLL